MNKVQRPSDPAWLIELLAEPGWKMIARCMLAQWRGLTKQQQDYIEDQWDRGMLPTSFSGSHGNYVIWAVSHDGKDRAASTADELIAVKVDHWPLEFEPAFKMP